MDGQHAGYVPEPARQKAGHVGVPSVAVGYVRIERVLGHRERAGEGIDGGGEPRVGAAFGLLPGRVATHGGVAALAPLIAEAAHLNGEQLGHRPGEVLDVHAGTAIDMGWILVREERNLLEDRHGALLRS